MDKKPEKVCGHSKTTSDRIFVSHMRTARRGFLVRFPNFRASLKISANQRYLKTFRHGQTKN
jgi:hypothetical protein